MNRIKHSVFYIFSTFPIKHRLLITYLLLYKVIVFLYLFYRFDYAILRYCGLVITSYHLMV